ncbi:MAG: protocadherin, partial [Pirellulales bacterium]
KVTPLIGAVNKPSQRVAMKIEGNDEVVVETGLYNLTNDEAPVLVHFGPDRQETRIFVRLKQPEDKASR